MNGILLRQPDRPIRYRRLWWISLIAASFSLAVYLYWSSRGEGPGFPLDDAWIHQTYARNLAQYGEWAYFPGEPSAGSTSPLWSALMAAGYFTGLSPYLWTYLLGGLTLAGVAVFGTLLGSRAAEAVGVHIPAQVLEMAPLGFALEWHLVWSAGSGMETLLAAMTALAVLWMLLSERPQWFLSGAFTGVGIWIRPDVLTLLGPALMVLAFSGSSWKAKLKYLGLLSAGFASLFIPYLMFNQILAGSWWPNTFYAKQAEYAVELQASLVSRILEQARLPLTGAGILLVPGFVLLCLQVIRRQSWAVIAGILWMFGYLLLYALHLPVTYQYGRYVMPMMPVYFALGLAGAAALQEYLRGGICQRVIWPAWLLSCFIVLGAFWLQGAQLYRRDVAFIEEEMVATARWVAQNTSPEALIAAHDIGALGYFSERHLLDLAGLVSPQVIPFIRDEAKLGDFLDAQNADYLVTFPGWYPDLVRQGTPVYVTGGKVAPAIGGENMAVYHWRFSR